MKTNSAKRVSRASRADFGTVIVKPLCMGRVGREEDRPVGRCYVVRTRRGFRRRRLGANSHRGPYPAEGSSAGEGRVVQRVVELRGVSVIRAGTAILNSVDWRAAPKTCVRFVGWPA